MLHPVKPSSKAGLLSKVVDLQRRLIVALCAKPAGAAVDLAWLQSAVWPELDKNWVQRFWELQTGRRAGWINEVARASQSEKDEILAVMGEQLDFRKLYDSPPGLRVRQTDGKYWGATPVRQAVSKLLVDFYAPCLSGGYRFPGNAQGLNRTDVVMGCPDVRVCPYCDSQLHLPTAELDHFLPKSSFPFLSCHPENLVPSCHEANKAKGTTPPLHWGAADQADAWFHPLWRSADRKLRLDILEQDGDHLRLELHAADAQDEPRVRNLVAMFSLESLWGRTIDADMQEAEKEAADAVTGLGLSADERSVRRVLACKIKSLSEAVGRQHQAIYNTALRQHASSSPAIVKEILRQCKEDAALPRSNW